MSTEPLYIYGDSHVAGLNVGLRNNLDKFPDFSVDFVRMLGPATDFSEPFFRIEGDMIHLTNEVLIERGAGLVSPEGVLLHKENAQHVVSLGLHTQSILTGVSWVTHTLWTTVNAGTEKQILSEAGLREIILYQNRYVLDFIRALVKCNYPLTVIEAPPPTTRFSLFELGYNKEQVLLFDDTVRGIMRDQILEIGADVLGPPEGVTKDGFLMDVYLRDDETDRHHGNADYSVKMLQKIQQYFAASEEPEEAKSTVSA
jgi:hypothetical protein